MRRCAQCKVSIDHLRAGAIYCGKTCTKRASRERIARAEAIRIEPSVAPGRQRKPTVNDVAEMFLTARGLETSFRFASKKVDPRLRAACSRVADAIGAAIDSEGMR